MAHWSEELLVQNYLPGAHALFAYTSDESYNILYLQLNISLNI